MSAKSTTKERREKKEIIAEDADETKTGPVVVESVVEGLGPVVVEVDWDPVVELDVGKAPVVEVEVVEKGKAPLDVEVLTVEEWPVITGEPLQGEDENEPRIAGGLPNKVQTLVL